MSDEAYINDVYPRYVEMLCAIIRLARHDADGGFIGAETPYSIAYWRSDARRFLEWLNDTGDNMPKGNASAQMYRCNTNEHGVLVCHFLGLRATDSSVKPDEEAVKHIRNGEDVLIQAKDMSQLKRLWEGE